MIIYKITNKVNGKIYIGQTIRTLEVRWKQHCKDAETNYKGMAILAAIQKYGKENFTVEQIDIACDRDELDKKEDYWINHYNSLSPNGYNLHTGGKHYECSEETKRKISESRSGEKNPLWGKHLSIEHKENIRKSLIGRVLTDEWKQKIGNGNRGRKLSDKQRELLKQINTGKKQSEETRKKRSESLKGHVVSEETRKKIGEKKRQHFGEKNPRSKKVLCVETGEIFASGRLAAKHYGLSGGVCSVCRGIGETAGGLHWRYV